MFPPDSKFKKRCDQTHQLTIQRPTRAVASSGNIDRIDIPTADISNYEKLRTIRRSRHSKVHIVRERGDHSKIYALKIFLDTVQTRSDNDDHQDEWCINNEIAVFSKTSDGPHIIRCYAVLDNVDEYRWPGMTSEPALLLEYMDLGNLHSIIHHHSAGLPLKTLPHIAHQILIGLSTLRSANIVHLDMKPTNILVNSAGDVKISDFGISRSMSEHNNRMDAGTATGTCAYMSPERMTFQCAGYASDVWAFGVILMEVVVGHFPLLPEGLSREYPVLFPAICLRDPPELPSEAATEDLKGFIACCMKKDADERSTVEELLQHPLVVAAAVEESKAEFLNLLAQIGLALNYTKSTD